MKIDSGISLSTVYRTMKLLEGLGAIHRHAFDLGEGGGPPSRFEPAGDEHHDHLIDIDTGDVIEFHSRQDRGAAGRDSPARWVTRSSTTAWSFTGARAGSGARQLAVSWREPGAPSRQPAMSASGIDRTRELHMPRQLMQYSILLAIFLTILTRTANEHFKVYAPSKRITASHHSADSLP